MAREPVTIIEFVDAVYAQNSRIVRADGATGGWIVDPGLPPTGENIVKYLADNALTPEAIVLTHAHADHVPHLVLDLARRIEYEGAREVAEHGAAERK